MNPGIQPLVPQEVLSDPSLGALPQMLVSLLERRHLDAMDPAAWHLSIESEAMPRPILHRVTALPSDEVPDEMLAQALGAGIDPGHATVLILEKTSSATGLHIGLRRSPGDSSWSTADALTGQSAAFSANIPGLVLASPAAMASDQVAGPGAFLEQAPCLAALTGIARRGARGKRAGFEGLVRAAGEGQFVMMLVAQALPPALIDAMVDTMRGMRGEIHAYTRRNRVQATSLSEQNSTNISQRDSSASDSMPLAMLAVSAAVRLGADMVGLRPLAHLAQPIATLASFHNQRIYASIRSRGESKSTGQVRTESRSAELLDANAQACEQILQRQEERLLHGRAQGYWRTAVYIAADTEATLKRVCGALKASATGAGGFHDPLRVIDAPRGLVRDAMRSAGFIRAVPSRKVEGMEADLGQESLSTMITTEELAVLTALPSCEVVGLKRPDLAKFSLISTSDGREAIRLGHVLGDHGRNIAPMFMRTAELNRSALVMGIRGSGKTTTCLRLLCEVYATLGLPFLVIEPHKAEYRELARVPGLAGLQVFTMGESYGTPLRLNPLEPIAGFPVARHIDLLKGVFKGVFKIFLGGIQVLEEALIEVYTDRGWSVRRNIDPRTSAGHSALEAVALVPNLQDLAEKIEAVVNRKGYSSQLRGEIKTALQQRIEGLLRGSKARMLDTRHSTSAELLFRQPAVVELQAFGDDEEKAFVMAMLFVLLREDAELRQQNAQTGRGEVLQHLTLIEESGWLFAQPRPSRANDSVSDDKPIAMFTNLLAEMRAWGEGFLLSEQTPTRLASELTNSTAVKFVHRLTDPDERLAIANSLGLSDEQSSHMNRLRPGEVVVHDPNAGDASLVSIMPPGFGPSLERLQPVQLSSGALLRGSGCELCESPCLWYDEVLDRGTVDLQGDCRTLIETALAGEVAISPPRPENDQADAGYRFCAWLAEARVQIGSRVMEHCRATGSRTPGVRELLSIERALTASAPVLRAIAFDVKPDHCSVSRMTGALRETIAAGASPQDRDCYS